MSSTFIAVYHDVIIFLAILALFLVILLIVALFSIIFMNGNIKKLVELEYRKYQESKIADGSVTSNNVQIDEIVNAQPLPNK